MRQINTIVLHCTAGSQNQTVDQVLEYFKNVLKWKVPGYHYICPPHHKYKKVHPIEKLSNGVAGHNSDTVHISYIGGVELLRAKDKDGRYINVVGKAIDNRTEQQISDMIEIIGKLRKLFPKAKIRGHRDFSPDKNKDGIIQPSEWMKACPAFDVVKWCKSVGIDPL